MVGLSRTCVTAPRKNWPGKASTRKRAASPSLMPPMSASAMLVSICICARSLAIWKSVGVLKLAATVWPISTLRATTMPEMGERITV